MTQGAFVTLVGFVAQDPTIRTTTTGKVLTKLRVGTTPRYRAADGEWQDRETSYFDVACWNRLAHHARQSLHKGEPVLIKGRAHIRSYEDKDGNARTSIEITADTVGHDLTGGTATYMRPTPLRATAPESPGVPDGRDAGNPDPEGIAGGEPGDMIDEEAIARFSQDLDEAELDEDDATAPNAAVPF